ncbi:MAG: hypothetical protein PHH60_01995 [Candidatus Margulisbacteria bacterium]|nr:hypothetical protein [Candidatus Margulisiibacteriota bacterium]
MADKAVGLLENNPLVILSGTNRPFLENCQTGKSYSSYKIFQELLRRGSAEYRDIRQALHLINRPGGYWDLDEFHHEMVGALRPADCYILDEIHQAFPRDPGEKRRDHWGVPIYRGEQYNVTMFSFWRKMEQLRREGKRFLMITALHPAQTGIAPQKLGYQQFQHDTSISIMADYFRAPLLELSPTYGG